jgi:surface-anchored protein
MESPQKIRWHNRAGGGVWPTQTVACVALCFGSIGCSGLVTDEAAVHDDSVSVAEQASADQVASATTLRARLSPGAVSSLEDELGTLLLSTALADEKLRFASVPSEAVTHFQRVMDLSEELDTGDLTRLSRSAAQVPVLIKRIKQALRAGGIEDLRYQEAARSLTAVKLAAQSLAARVAELQNEGGFSPLQGLTPAEREAVVTLSGPLVPGSSWYVLDEGHIDAIDVAYEDDELGLSIHDESVDPDVERDPAKTILLVKSAAKVQVPDARFAFLGPVGTDVWILPEGQPEAEAAGILWPGIATAEVDAGVFSDDQVDVDFRNLVGPDGLSLFESPQDEVSNPTVLVDSENGLPDTLTTPVGIHRHVNWAFESPGVYLLRVQARGRLAELPGTPWVSSANAVLKFVVLP